MAPYINSNGVPATIANALGTDGDNFQYVFTAAAAAANSSVFITGGCPRISWGFTATNCTALSTKLQMRCDLSETTWDDVPSVYGGDSAETARLVQLISVALPVVQLRMVIVTITGTGAVVDRGWIYATKG